ncbi:dTDP-glucose 4,6-dehydratase [Pararhodospirillum oryzae]|uniref:dTDP-glucose 4,6-dehydratase n=1 Tax=Pararhodospirillum oryzae TaxID=478448 RepID=UPI001FE3CBD5|nr:dTDP-glucose 4,6-dehydratase [Pararhodospirillum oryzae]
MLDAQDCVLVTGGAGFIGSAVLRHLFRNTSAALVNVDKLTYAGDLEAVADLAGSPRYAFAQVDICDAPAIEALLARHRPTAIMHLAAESHVDRSIDDPGSFIRTNVLGTFTMLDAARRYWSGLDEPGRARFRFHHISTDEVFGSLGSEGYFHEGTPYDPRSPYSASKAGSDHLVRAWHHTYGLPVLLTNCSNNYGPFQFPEKLIPVMIGAALAGRPLPVYGQGANVRDWLYVEDHAEALVTVLTRGEPGETYVLGGGAESSNLDLIKRLCAILDRLRPDPAGSYERLISFVTDRPGHDFRYAIDYARVKRDLGWQPRHSLDEGLAATVSWYLDHQPWMERLRQRKGADRRLGLAGGR